MPTAKTYHAMMAGSRFEFKNGRSVYFVGDKGQTGSYSTDDSDEQKELDIVCKTAGSGISLGDVPTTKEASSGIAADILKKAQEAKDAEKKAAGG